MGENYHNNIDIEYEFINQMLDVLSLTTWGLYNQVDFRNKEYKKIKKIENILKCIEEDNCLYINTDNLNFLYQFQKAIKGLIEVLKKRQEIKRKNFNIKNLSVY